MPTLRRASGFCQRDVGYDNWREGECDVFYQSNSNGFAPTSRATIDNSYRKVNIYIGGSIFNIFWSHRRHACGLPYATPVRTHVRRGFHSLHRESDRKGFRGRSQFSSTDDPFYTSGGKRRWPLTRTSLSVSLARGWNSNGIPLLTSEPAWLGHWLLRHYSEVVDFLYTLR